MLYNKDPVLPFQYKDQLEQNPDAEPRDCMNIASPKGTTMPDFFHVLEKNRAEIFEKATKNISKAQKVQARNYNKRNSAPGVKPLQLYEKCLKKNMKDKSRKEKMVNKFTGPYLITGITQNGYLLKNKYAHQLKRSVPAAQLVRYYGTMSVADTENEKYSDTESETFEFDTCQRSSGLSKPSQKVHKDEESIPVSGQIIIMPSQEQSPCSSDESMIDVGQEYNTVPQTKNPWGDINVDDIPIEIVDDLFDGNESDSDDSEADEEIQVEEPGWEKCRVTFNPLTDSERIAAAATMFVRLKVQHDSVNFRGSGNVFPKEPVVSIQAKPDGACLFNSISLFLTGTELYAAMLRHAVCNFICDEKNLQLIKVHLPVKYKNGKEYIKESGRRQPFSWGTDTEIYACTIMTGYDIMVFSTQKKWLIYSKVAKGQRTSKNAIYLNNVSGNHFDPVMSSLDY